MFTTMCDEGYYRVIVALCQHHNQDRSLNPVAIKEDWCRDDSGSVPHADMPNPVPGLWFAGRSLTKRDILI